MAFTPRVGRPWLVLVPLIFLCKVAMADAQPLTQAERTAYAAELKPLQDKLQALRKDSSLSADLLADANVFIKAVIWAIDLEPLDDPNGRALIQTGIRRARSRIDALSKQSASWVKRIGKVARGFQSEVDGSIQPYGVIVPTTYDPQKPTRLDVVLHGSSGDRARGIAELHFLAAFDAGDDAGDDASAVVRDAPGVNYIEVHPLGRLGENAYRFEGESDVFEAIDAVCRNYNVDRARIVLRGSSLGGVGAWAIGLKRPDRFVAIGPAAGPVDTYVFAASKRSNFIPLAPLTSWQKLLLHEVDAIDYAANAGMVPVVALMGDRDEYFPSHLLMQEAFKKEGIPFVGIVEAGAGHGPTPKAFAQQYQLLGERAARSRDPGPRRVRFVTWTLKFSKCDWVEVLGLGEHYRRAEIDATMDDAGNVVIDQEPLNITRFAIAPPALRSSGGGGGGATLTIAGKRVDGRRDAGAAGTTGTAPVPAIVERTHDGWRFRGPLDPSDRSRKRPGLQGPIDDAFATPFLVVRGTGQAWNPVVGNWASSNLARLQDEWRRHYRADLPVKDDSDLTAADIRKFNLILFGDPGSNHWIRDVLPHMPMRWTKDRLDIADETYAARNHAPALIYPNPLPDAGGSRYIVLNSGHTYHDYELQLSYMVFPRIGDWAVMSLGGGGGGSTPPGASGVAERVLNSGFFDEFWQNPSVPR